ncbi:MAG: transcription termination factor NusA [Candidatus Falkowbacteria bacterium]
MSDITSAMKQICEEKNLSYEAVVETIESALAAAYRKDFGEKNQNIKVEFDPETGKSKVYDVKTVVEDMPPSALEGATEGEPASDEAVPKKEIKKDLSPVVLAEGEEVRKFNPKTELQIKDAKLMKKMAKVGDVIKTKLEIPADYGRMAAQTAKQVIIQKLREAEREMIFSEFKDKEHEVVAGVVQRREGRIVLVDLDKAVGVLPAEEQIMNERYRPGDRVKVYIKQVGITPKGPEILLSRTSDEILKKVFYLEIPEVSNGLVEIKAVAREAGSRSKVAVFAISENVDPIGSCVGQRGSRIQTIISELGGEKIDIIEYDEDLAKFIGHALAPAKILSVEINQEEKKAVVKVAEDQLSLAIGREGQNVRLAARLTGCKLDIVGEKAQTENVKIKETVEADTEAAKKAGEKAEEVTQPESEKSETEEKVEKKEEEPSEAEALVGKKAEKPSDAEVLAGKKVKKTKKSKE